MRLRKSKTKRVAPRPRRRRRSAEDEEIDADQLTIGSGDKPSRQGRFKAGIALAAIFTRPAAVP